MKKAMAVLLSVCLMLGLAGCGGKKNDENLGKYNCVSLMLNDSPIDPEGEYIELKSGGKASLYLTDSPDDGTWKLSGSELTMKIQDKEMTGTLKKGVIQIEIEGVECIFALDGADYELPKSSGIDGSSSESASEPAGTEQPQLTAEEVWPAEWYGSLTVDEAWGGYASYAPNTWYAAAHIGGYTGEPFFEVFLPDNGYDEEPMLSMYIQLDTSHFEIHDDAGWIANMTIPPQCYGDYYITYAEDRGNLIVFSSRYDDPDSADSGFSFTVQLRPYGSVWDEENDVLPDNYQDYLEWINGSDCTQNVTDGLSGEVLVDRGVPVYVPGAPYGSGSSSQSSAGGFVGGTQDSSEGAGAGEYLQEDGKLVSRDGYFSFYLPSGWDYLGTQNDNNQISAYNDKLQITVMLDYLNGYTVEEMAKRETFSTDTYAYDTSIPLGTTTVDGRTAYYAGPVVSFGRAHYYVFTDWGGDGTQFVNINIETLSSDDPALISDFLDTQTWQDTLDTVHISSPG